MTRIEGLAPGVLTGKEVLTLFKRLRTQKVALPAVNVVDSNGINGLLEAAATAATPLIVQFSHGGSIFMAGKGLPSATHAAIVGAQAGAEHLHRMASAYGVSVIAHTDHAARPLLPWIDGLLTLSEAHYAKRGKALFSSHMIDLSTEPLKQNIDTCCHYLERMAKIEVMLEIEVGCTGGVEDGVDHQHLQSERLYTTPEDVAYAYERLSQISPLFSIAASFGNVHGVYAAGNVILKPKILQTCQQYVAEKYNLAPNPLSLVFHGSSGSSPSVLQEAVSYGVVKVNMDTDTQWASWKSLLDYYQNNAAYLQAQLGNPDGPEQPNKHHYDPRVWLRAAQEGFIHRVISACHTLGCAGIAPTQATGNSP